MIYLECNDDKTLSWINELLSQKNLNIVSDKSSKFFLSININKTNDSLIIKSNKEKKHLTLPLDFKFLYQTIADIFSTLSIKIDDLNYLPFQYKLIKGHDETFLTDKHNQIFGDLVLYADEGINKYDLYQKIWPKDKDIQINKLDTHLTNLKSQLRNELKYLLKFTSEKGNIKLIIN